MSDAIKKLHDYLAKSPSVVYPQDVLEYLPAIEAENVALRERGAKTLEVGTRWMAKAARLESENAKLRELVFGLKWCCENYRCNNLCPLYDKSEQDHCREDRLLSELGIEVDE